MKEGREVQELGSIFVFTYEQTLAQLIQLAPKLLAATLIVVLGWILAKLLARASVSLVALLFRFFARLLPSEGSNDWVYRQSHQVMISRVMFWLVMLFFIAAGCNALGLEFFSRWMEQLFSYFPHLFAGAVIIVGGYMVSRIIQVMVTAALSSSAFQHGELLGSVAQIAVFFTALVIGVEQLGINVAFLTNFFIVVSAVLLSGFSLAFGLAARSSLENAIAMQQLRKRVRLGDHLRIGRTQGYVIEMAAYGLVIESEGVTSFIPGNKANSTIISVLGDTENRDEKS